MGSDTHMWHVIVEPFGQVTPKINERKNAAIICKREAKKAFAAADSLRNTLSPSRNKTTFGLSIFRK